MLFIKLLKQHLTKTYTSLTLLGKLLLTLQIASMFVPIIDTHFLFHFGHIIYSNQCLSS